MRNFLEKMFFKSGMDRRDSIAFSWISTVMIYFVMTGCMLHGLSNANDPLKCRVTSIANTMLSFPYVVGCNLGKDRWNIRVNPEIIK